MELLLFVRPLSTILRACSSSTYTDILYDCMHYALHHTKLPQYMRDMKKYHLAHHYKNFELAFGVTSKSSSRIPCPLSQILT